jgi:hypothetical protein
MTARVERKRGRNTVRFLCAICKQPLFLSRRIEGKTNRWFVHDGKSEQCPWYEGNRLTPDQAKALIYRGQQEGAKHLEYKRFLAKWLSKDPSVSGIALEQTTFSEVMKGEWRRPDVKCLFQGHPLVFEIQLSYTFLSDVIARDEFYKREGIFIVWVFAGFDLQRAAVTDEAFFNHRNLFVLDAAAMSQTAEQEVLTFSGYRQSPRLIDGQMCNVWDWDFVSLHDVTFPNDTFRPFFFDYEAAYAAVEIARLKALQSRQRAAWQQNINEFLDLALRYYDSDHDKNAKSALLSKVDELKEDLQWHQELETLREYEFYGWHGVLAVLLSIKLHRPVSYNSKLTVFQVIEAGLRTSHRDVGQHAFAILYIWAYKAYKPTMTLKNTSWLISYAHKIKASIDNGENIYRRFTGYDKAIGLLFPELDQHLVTAFGTPPAQEAL